MNCSGSRSRREGFQFLLNPCGQPYHDIWYPVKHLEGCEWLFSDCPQFSVKILSNAQALFHSFFPFLRSHMRRTFCGVVFPKRTSLQQLTLRYPNKMSVSIAPQSFPRGKDCSPPQTNHQCFFISCIDSMVQRLLEMQIVSSRICSSIMSGNKS